MRTIVRDERSITFYFNSYGESMMPISARTPLTRFVVTTAALALTIATFPSAHAQPAVLAPRLQATVRDTGLHRSNAYFGRVTRGPTGRLLLALPGHGVLMYAGNAEPGWVRTGSGARAWNGNLSWMGDTLAVSRWRSWDLFDPGGAFVACRGSGRTPGEFSVQVFPTIPLPGGLVVGELRPPWAGQGIEIELVVSRGQEVLRTLARRAAEPARIDVPFPWGGGEWSVPPPLRTTTLWSVADNGSGAVVVEQEPARGAGSQAVRVRRVALDGRTRFDVVLRVPALPVTEARRERQIAEWAHHHTRWFLGSTIQRDPASVRDAFRRHVPFPAYHPPVAGVVAGADGSAWLRLSSNGDSAEWVRLDTSGRERGRVVLPEGFREAYADAGGLWGFQRGPADEVQVLVVTDRTPPFRPFVVGSPAPAPPAAIGFSPCA